MRNHTDALRSAPILPLLMRYTAGVLTALVLANVYTLVDTLFVSYTVGAEAVGGISVAFPFVIFQSAVSTALGGGAAALISQRAGKGEMQTAGEIALNAMISFWLTAILVTGVGLLTMDLFLAHSGLSGEIYDYAREYLFILLLGNVFSTGFSAVIRAEGNMLYGVLIWVIPISVNILLDYLLIVRMGQAVRGSAIATVISQFISFCMSILFFTRFSKLSFRGARLHFRTVRSILSYGTPSLVQQSGLSLSLAVMNFALARAGGEQAVSAYAYIYKILTFAYLPFTAVAQGLSPIAGYNHGAGNRARVKSAFYIAMALAVSLAIVLSVVLLLFPERILVLLTKDDEIVHFAAEGLKIIACALPFIPPAFVAGTVCQAQGKIRASLLLQASESVLLLVPAILILWQVWGLNGIWYAPLAAALCACIPVFIYAKKEFSCV